MRAIVDRLESVRRAPNKKHPQSVDIPSAAPALLRLAHAANLSGGKMISRAGKYDF